MAGFTDILTALQNGVQGISDVSLHLSHQNPDFLSGPISASTLVQVGYVRLLGVSVIVGGAAGLLHNVNRAADAASTNQIYTIPTTAGYYDVHMVFPAGLVCVPGAGQIVALFYARS